MIAGYSDYRRQRPSVTPEEIGAELTRRAEPYPMEQDEPDLLPDAVRQAVDRAAAQQTRQPTDRHGVSTFSLRA